MLKRKRTSKIEKWIKVSHIRGYEGKCRGKAGAKVGKKAGKTASNP